MKYEFIIDTIHCEGCVNRIKNVLSNIKGIINYDISLQSKKLDIAVKNEKVINEVKNKLYNIDFEVK